jgi:hypothetical protein
LRQAKGRSLTTFRLQKRLSNSLSEDLHLMQPLLQDSASNLTLLVRDNRDMAEAVLEKASQSRFLSPGRRARSILRIRRLLILAVFILILLSISFRYQRSRKSEVIQQPLIQPHLKKSDLSLTLNRTDSDIPSIKVTIINYHYSTTVSLLMWDSPFDPQAVATGMFRVVERSSGEEVPSLGMRVSRLLAPKAEDFVELLPRHAVTKDVPLEEPDIVLESGKSYDIQVRSTWKAIWHANIKESGEAQLKRIGGPTGLVNWDYESNVFQLDIPKHSFIF